MVPVDEFQDYVQDMKKNDNYGFDQQYQVNDTWKKLKHPIAV